MAKMTDRQTVNRWPHVRIDQIIYDGEPCIDRMTDDTLDLLNTMCRDAERRNGWLHRINSSYRDGETGFHPKGKAFDLVFFVDEPGDVDVWDQYRFAKQYPWGGIGAYPEWNAGAGIHVDTRQGIDHVATWWRDARGVYRGINEVQKVYGVMV